jgi:hypothetical protein
LIANPQASLTRKAGDVVLVSWLNKCDDANENVVADVLRIDSVLFNTGDADATGKASFDWNHLREFKE